MTRRSSPAASWTLLASVLGAAVAAACGEHAPPRFPHREHLGERECGKSGKPECLTCNTCHDMSARESAHAKPESSLCVRCHRDDAHDVVAVLEVRTEHASGPIRFDHDQHLAMSEVRGQCVGCHAGVVDPARPELPPMSQCFSCHEHEKQWNAAECAPCHTRRDLERTLPQTFLRHDASFSRRHGQLAQEQKALCQSCHSQAQCDDCHDMTQDLSIERRRPDQIDRAFVHRGDFMIRHAIEAQSQPSRCMSCHAVETCDSCHVARGVSGNAVDALNPHPPGWVGTDPNSSSFHGREARRDIVLCASCHDQGPATNCIRCHKVGGFGGNPHPSGWKSSQTESSTMCRYCHE